MRILRVKGRNLASLGRFDIDFERDVRDNIFAIIGSTGSGKSTILDAICFGMYGRIPRLPGRRTGSRVRLDDGQELDLNDVRNIMTRGTDSCSAEVDFTGRDGVRYRATYVIEKKRRNYGHSCRLCPVSPDGTLGTPVFEDRKPGQISRIGDSVAAVTGLTWDQFRKVIVLPQGDFAAFLEQSGDEKAKLLEELTGTEIYDRIQTRLNEKLAAVNREIDDRRRLLGSIEFLSDEQLAALGERLAGLKREKEDLGAAAEIARDTVKKAGEIAAQETERDRLEKERAAIGAETERLAAEYRTIELYEAAGACREAWAGAAAKREECAALARGAEDAARAAGQTRNELEEARTALGKAGAEAARIAREYEDGKERIAAARDLEGRIGAAAGARDSAQSDLGKLEREVADLEGTGAANDRKLGELRAELAALDERNAANLRFAEVCAHLPLLSAEARNFVRERAKRDEAERERAGAELEASRLEAAIAAAREKLAAAGADLLKDPAGEDSWRNLAGFLREADENAAARDLGRNCEKGAEGAEKIAGHLADRAENRARAGGLRESLAAFGDPAKSPASAADGKCAALREKIAEYEAELRLADFTIGLRPGRPCPCCGSLDHPKAGAADAGLLKKHLEKEKAVARAELETAEAARDKLLADLARDREALRNAAAAAAAAEEALGKERGTFGPVLAAIAAGAAGLRELLAARGDGLAESVAAGLAACLAGTDGEAPAEDAEALKARAAGLKQSAAALALLTGKLRAAAGAAAEPLDLIGRNRAEAASRAEKAARARGDRDAAAAAMAAHRESAAATGAEGFAEFWEEAAGAPELEPILSRYETIRGELASFRDDRDKKQGEIDALANKAGTDAELLGAARGNAEAKRRDLQERGEELERLRGEHRGLFGGRDSAAVEKEFRDKSAAAESERARRDAETKVLAARLEGREADERRIRGELGVKRHETALALAGYRGAAAAARAAGLSRADVVRGRALTREDLGRAREAVAENEKDRQENDRARGNCAATLGTLLGQLEALAGKLPEGVYDGAARSVSAEYLERLGAEELRIGEETAAARAKLAGHEANVGKAKGIEDEIANIAAANKGLTELRDLFREEVSLKAYAQSITFGYLVARANRYILAFTGRYELRNVSTVFAKDSDRTGRVLELVVADRDEGDRERPVGSLSGGEKFRISLGLALGLSDLITSNIRVETMFIDEGFDTLDAETLDQVLNSLRNIKSGRQIGIISHVEQIVNGNMIQTRLRVRRAGGSSVRSEVAFA